ncbi:hypothetical protein A2973_05575 [Candidatus Gottesmanbacteria bacterium RIFCSPLOWO2_01_FULL_49_10]|uniref:Uncharacterized protein n=1 Tax=Candidatus Gottesmanbacteria bacterium RIFCSPLOWO2_01_FULL_49_10 TaxID=1798396 RepID=A0A1F6AW24_9BACT|nr:MAG: hypothetical protein A2973_05575 [Candidatus Gottesmanbacteria bacterium RIFCSPLOWO2_01_FULL_49_10]
MDKYLLLVALQSKVSAANATESKMVLRPRRKRLSRNADLNKTIGSRLQRQPHKHKTADPLRSSAEPPAAGAGPLHLGILCLKLRTKNPL